MIRIAKQDGKTNIADLFTKLLDGPKLNNLCSWCMWTDYAPVHKDLEGFDLSDISFVVSLVVYLLFVGEFHMITIG